MAKDISGLQSRILDHIRRVSRGRANFKQLVREMGARGGAREDLEQALMRLAARGELIETRKGHYLLPEAGGEYTVGRLNMHRDGYGFLILDTPRPGVDGDIYIPRESASKAMHGDRVVVRIGYSGPDGRTSGEIVRVVRRAHTTVVGEFRVRSRGYFVVPYDDRIQQWIEITGDSEIPPPSAASDRVGVNVEEVAALADLDGMVVDVEILQFPEDGDRAVGRLIEILGHAGDFGVDVEIMIRKHHIPHRFPAPALDQARKEPATVSADELTNRRDFREMDVVTIDGETARDFDDAVWVQALDNGNYALHVHIADVSHYVKLETPIDEEARLRGTSVYFPDRAVPMLPVELSTDICSLKPAVDRLVLSALMEIDRSGDVVAREFTRGVIRSAARMTYTAVAAILEGDPQTHGRFGPMRDLALILNRKRVRRGSIDFDLPEPLIEFDEFGVMTGVTRSPRNIAHRIIEEFMLAANEAVAGHLEDLGIPMIFRIHEQPDPKRVLEFEEVAAQFGYSLGAGAVPVKRHVFTSRKREGGKTRQEFAIPDEVPVTSKNYQKLVAKIEGKPEERVLSYLMLRSLKQARYSAENRGHFALAAESYTHFTSPIRRYPDLMVHRILGAWLDGLDPLWQEGALKVIADDSSATERRAAEAERELVEWKKARFMEDRVGEEFSGLIISTTRFGFFVELEELFVEGLAPIDLLPGDRFVYHENTRQIIGQRTRKIFGIGDRVKVCLERVDVMERKLQFAVVEERPVRKKKRKGPQMDTDSH